MNAGTIAVLDNTADEQLASWARDDGETPALDVQETQDRLGGSPVQTGMAASTVEDSRQQVRIDGTDISVDTVDHRETVTTEWAADVTGAGVAAAQSVYDDAAEFSFPFDLLTTQSGREVRQVTIDTDALARAWQDDDRLRDTWMRAERDENDDFSVHYGDVPDDVETSAGVGFKTAWNGTVVSGVAWPSGYVDVHREFTAGEFIDFIADEILPFAEAATDDGPGEQMTFGADA